MPADFEPGNAQQGHHLSGQWRCPRCGARFSWLLAVLWAKEIQREMEAVTWACERQHHAESPECRGTT